MDVINNTLIGNEIPEAPDKDNCCGNGCNPCIFDIHKQLVEKWKRKQYIYKSEQVNLLKPLIYQSFIVEKVENINSNYILMHLRYKEQLKSDIKIHFYAGQHVVINILSWSKPFTPIAWTDKTLTFLIRIYSSGINTNKLKNIELGSEVQVRGPYGDFRYTRNSFKNIIMFGMGSAIAVFYPIINLIVDDEMDETQVHLHMGFQSINQIPLIKELKSFVDFWNVDCTLYITEENNVNNICGIDIQYERINEIIVKTIVKKYIAENTLILICGNNDFNESLELWSTKYHHVNYHVFK